MTERGIAQLVSRLGGELRGSEADSEIHGVLPPDEAGPEHVTVFLDPRMAGVVEHTRAAAVLTSAMRASRVTDAGRTAWIHPDPGGALVELVDILHPAGPGTPPPLDPERSCWVSPRASVEAGALLEPGCVIHEGVLVGPGSRVGAGAYLGPGTRAGARVEIGPGAALGVRGFGLRNEDGKWIPVRHVGVVDIGDDVSIGARTVIARGTLGSTRIGSGTRIDAQVMLGHNVRIGRDCAIAAQVGIGGSTIVGDGVLIGGQAGLADHVTVGDGARIAARSGVAGDVPAGATFEGYPAQERWTWLRMMATLKKLAGR
jgi:UDP-3-O-[3-hydroxymyristoyl] glucosamine N-acyltransferase